MKRAPTAIVSCNRSLHDCLHPITDDSLIFRTEIVGLIRLMFDPEAVLSRVRSLVDSNFVTQSVDVSLNLRLLSQLVSLIPSYDQNRALTVMLWLLNQYK